jgi:periplasmic protein TonB
MKMKVEMKKVGKNILRVLVVTAAAMVLVGSASAQDQEKRLKVASDLQQAKLVSNTMPVYPVLAKRGRVEGTVRLSAVIGKDGSVERLETVSGHPILEQAAVEAVKKWKYKPTILNGEPVEVVTTIDVVFKLS